MANERGEVGGVFWTCNSVLRTPRAFFSRPAGERSGWRPVAFAMVVAAIGLPAAELSDALFRGASPGNTISAALTWLLIGPLVTVARIYFGSALMHLSLIIARGRSRPFQETLECVGYSSATILLSIVPIVGVVVGYVWDVVVLILGLKLTHKTTTTRAVFAVFAPVVAPVVLALGLRGGCIEAFKMPSGSMTPTLMIGDHIFVSKLAYGPLVPWMDKRLFSRLPPQRGDVMVFKFPENKEQDFIKRVIALPGDTLEAIDGRPIINGWLVPHCYVGPFKYENRVAELFIEHLEDRSYFTLFDANPDEQTCSSAKECDAGLACKGGLCGIHQGPFKVDPEEAWVMDDNRNNSHDSRTWRGGLGAGVPFENIKGRAMFVWMSFGPGGGVAQDRLFVSVHGRPTLPGAHEAALREAVDKCLRERPPIAQTTPPAPGGPRAR